MSNLVEDKAIDFWRQEWGEEPNGPLYGKGETLKDRWESLSKYNKDYYRSYVRSELERDK